MYDDTSSAKDSRLLDFSFFLESSGKISGERDYRSNIYSRLPFIALKISRKRETKVSSRSRNIQSGFTFRFNRFLVPMAT